MEKVLAAVRMKICDLPPPDIPEAGAMTQLEGAGICGTYAKPPISQRSIMGQECIGRVPEAGREFTRRRDPRDGDRVLAGRNVGCIAADRLSTDSLRAGSIATTRAPHLMAGVAQSTDPPWNSMLHRMPDALSQQLAGRATPMANGDRGALFDSGLGHFTWPLAQDPGQKGPCQAVPAPIARGHNCESSARPLQPLASDRSAPEQPHDAMEAVRGAGDAVHVSPMPWM